MIRARRDSPNSISSEYSTRKEHSNIDGCSLNNRSNRDNNTHHLHEPETTESITDEGLREGADCFAGDVDSDNLRRSEDARRLIARV